MNPGTRLGPYEIVEPLGAGGMGEVYRALDTRLGREVAIKVLPPMFAADVERLARFEQEARASAALNHPHIAQVFDVGASEEAGEDGTTTRFIVQELLRGRSLRQELEEGPLPLRRTLELGIEVAEALQAAHAAGITHRDLKPENVFVTGDGHAKLLDFGLAKLTELSAASGPDATMSPTLLGTMVGQVLGTAGYMAPEQIDGRVPVDHRADLFAFGALLYELSTGRRAFAGRSVADTLSRIQHDEPTALDEIEPTLPYDLQRVVAKALAKDPADRYQSAADLVVDLRTLRREVDTGTMRGPARPAAEAPGVPERAPGMGRLALLAVGVAAVAALLGWWLGNAGGSMPDAPASGMPEMQFLLELPEEAVGLPRGQGVTLAITPAGDTVGTVLLYPDGSRRMYQRRLDSVGMELMASATAAIEPAYTTDGQWLSFGDGFTSYYRVQATGGEAFKLCDSCVDGTWGDDGAYYYINAGALYRIRGDASQPPEKVLDPPVALSIPYMARPAILPGSRAAVVEVGNYEHGGVAVVGFDDGRVLPVATAGSSPLYVGGTILFARDSSIFAIAFDPERFALGGEAVPVLQGVRVENGGAAQFALADNGTAVYSPALGEQRPALTIVNRTGEVEQVVGSRGTYSTPRVSPDGRSLVVVAITAGRSDLLRIDLATGARAQLTTTGTARSPAWSPDGRWIAFSDVSQQGGFAVLQLEPESLVTRELARAEFPLLPSSVSPDGSSVLYIDTGVNDVFRIPVDPEGGEALPEPVLQSRWTEESPALSPDGALLVYESDRTGDHEIYLRELSSGRELQVTVTGGTEVMWAPSGDEIYFRDVATSQWAAVRIDRETQMVVSPAEMMFSATPYWQGLVNAGFDALPDGRFVFVRHRDPGDPDDQVRVVTNFTARLPR